MTVQFSGTKKHLVVTQLSPSSVSRISHLSPELKLGPQETLPPLPPPYPPILQALASTNVIQPSHFIFHFPPKSLFAFLLQREHDAFYFLWQVQSERAPSLTRSLMRQEGTRNLGGPRAHPLEAGAMADGLTSERLKPGGLGSIPGHLLSSLVILGKSFTFLAAV